MSFVFVTQTLLFNKIAGNCPVLYLQCPRCEQIAQAYSLDACDFDWAVTLKCCSCDETWTICNVCPHFRNYLVTQQAKNDHNCKVHMRKKRASPSAVTQIHTEEVEEREERDTASPSAVSQHPAEVLEQRVQSDTASTDRRDSSYDMLLTDDFSVSALEEAANGLPALDDHTLQSVLQLCDNDYYYYREQHLEKQYLLAMNVFASAILTTSVQNDDAVAHFALGRLLLSMTQTQQQLLLDLFGKLKPSMLHHLEDLSTSGMSFVLPRTMANVRVMYTGGASSMVNTIPLTPLQTLGSGKNQHSYCSLIDSLQTFLACGKGLEQLKEGTKTFDSTQPVVYPRQCRRVREIYDEAQQVFENMSSITSPLLVSAYELFCDDFNPTKSMITANLHGTWALHAGFLESTTDASVSEFNNRFLIALGNKGADHTEVLSRLEREIRLLREGNVAPMFVSLFRCVMQPILDNWVRNGDQPERRAVNGLKLGQRTNHARFGFVLAITKVGRYLPSCREYCRKKVEEAVINCDPSLFDLICPLRKCTNWSFHPRNTLLHATPPDNFPADEIPIGEDRLPPLVLTYAMLREACIKTHRQVYLGNWTPVEAETFLDHFGINANVASGVVNNAVNCNLLTELQGNPEANPELYRATIADRVAHPDQYQVHKLPPVWYSGQTLQQFPEPKMHLLANIMKAVMHLMETALGCCSNGRFEKLCESSTKDQLEYCAKTLRLPWLNLTPFDKEGFVGYKSENWIALARYVKMMAVDILSIPDEPPIEFPSIEQQPTWTMKYNKAWLKIRGLPQDGKAKDLRERVAGYLKEPNPPDVLPRSRLNTTHIVRMLASCGNMVAHSLARQITDSHITQTEYSIIRFLNDVDAIDSVIRQKRGKGNTDLSPIWHDRYTLLCLLNCPADMRWYGSAHCYWEGRDEKVLKEVKKGFHCFSKNWTTNLHKEFNVQSCLARSEAETTIEKAKTESEEKLSKAMPDLYVYNSWADALSVFNSGSISKPMVLVALQNGGFGVVVEPNTLYRLRIQYVTTHAFVAMFEIHFRLAEAERKYGLVSDDVSNIVIAFPKQLDGLVYWALFDSEWKELSSDYMFHYGTQ